MDESATISSCPILSNNLVINVQATHIQKWSLVTKVKEV